MSRFLSIALATSVATSALAAPKPAEIKIFGDWAVACDNGLACEMTSLIHGDNFDGVGADGFDSAAEIAVKRSAGPNGAIEVSVNFNGFIWEGEMPDGTTPFTLAIDGRRIVRGNYGGEGFTYKGSEAMRISQALIAGRVLTLTDVRGKVMARNALDGSSASMRYMDAQQGRAGTVTALVAKGKKPASAVRTAPALPVLTVSGRVGQPVTPTNAEIEKMRTLSECGADENETNPITTAALNGGGTLVLLSCGHGAYNSSEAPFIITGKGAGRRIALADFDMDGGWGDGLALVNSYWDEKTLTLSSYAKGRGLGDCGSSESWVWDSTMFRLSSASGMSDCRGSLNWLTTWRANVAQN